MLKPEAMLKQKNSAFSESKRGVEQNPKCDLMEEGEAGGTSEAAWWEFPASWQQGRHTFQPDSEIPAMSDGESIEPALFLLCLLHD